LIPKASTLHVTTSHDPPKYTMSHSAQYESHQYTYIDMASDLVDFCKALSGGDFIAIDTEFLREKTYYPELC